MRYFANPRPQALLLLSLLAGCGGVANDVGQPLSDALSCSVRNCTESSTLNVDEISPRFTATQNNDERTLLVEGSLGKSANVFTTVLPASNERLSASVDGGGEVAMSNPDGKRLDYSASLAAASAQPVVRVIFTRAGVSHVSEVTMPAGFVLLQPAGSATLSRASADLAVRFSAMASTTAVANGNCTRTDGSSFSVQNETLPATPESGGYSLKGAAIDDALNLSSRSHNNNLTTTPLVSRCQLTVAWRRTAWGRIAPTLNSHGALGGYRQATHGLSYDAQR